jgi:hypothetical protein
MKDKKQEFLEKMKKEDLKIFLMFWIK